MKIFIIHNGRQEYLLYCVKQLLKYNDTKDIIFLTDNKDLTEKYIGEKGITYENISDYFSSAKEFEKVYKHMSYNSEQYELFCFQRWFVIRDYCKRHKIDNFCHIDSDVLLYCNAESHYTKFLNDKDFCYTSFSGHTFFGTFKGINEFVEFLKISYSNNINYLKKFSTGERICKIVKNSGFIDNDESNCVTDMTLIDIFVKEHKDDLNKIDIGIIHNNSVFDGRINLGEGFEYGLGLKKIYWNNNKPYGFLKGDKKCEKIFFNSLHFQGNGKLFMKNFYENISPFYHVLYDFPRLKIVLTKGFIQLSEEIFRSLGIHGIMRNLWIKILKMTR